MTVIPVVTDALGTVSKRFVQGLEDYNNNEIGQNTKKSPGDWKTLPVTR